MRINRFAPLFDREILFVCFNSNQPSKRTNKWTDKCKAFNLIFHFLIHFQNQLLELKNNNYTLEEKCRKQSVEAMQWRERCESLEKDLSKYQNLAKLNPLSFAKSFQLNKGAKEKELIDSLNEEKDLYQRRLQNQEDEFRQSNELLRLEIVNLMNEIKVLKSQPSAVKVPKDELSDSSPSPNRCSSFNSNDSDGEVTFQLTSNGQRKPAMSYAILSEKEQLESSLDATTKSLDTIKEENRTLRNRVGELTDHNQSLEQKSRQLKETNGAYLSEISTLKQEVESTKVGGLYLIGFDLLLSVIINSPFIFSSSQKEIANLKELADKRKSTIDELQCHIEDTEGKAELAIENANKKLNEARASLSKELSLLKTEKKDLMLKIGELHKAFEIVRNKKDVLEVQCTQLNEENRELNNKLTELSGRLEEHEANKLLIEQLKEEKQQIVLQLHAENELKLKKLNESNESLKEQLAQKEHLIGKLRRDVEDQIEERKIHEKRGVMIVRELKKQLNNEKKLKERLQERFGELQSEKSFDLGSKSFDAQSVGSWSFLSSSNKDPNVTGKFVCHQTINFVLTPFLFTISGKNNSSYSIHSNNSTDGNLVTNSTSNGINSPISDIHSTNGSSPQLLEKENTELLSRLGKLQSEKWELEEKVNNILLAIQKLENDLAAKQRIISYYCMERRAEPPIKPANSTVSEKFTVKKVVDNFIKDKDSDNLKEINRKLQRMLEELLTKNIALENNLELLTDELQSVKKVSS